MKNEIGGTLGEEKKSIAIGDFVEIDYTAKVADSGAVFDTTDMAVAKENGLFSKDSNYVPVTVCIGKHQVIEGLDDALVGRETKKEYAFGIPAEKGFGKKNMSLIQLVATGKFKQEKIVPMPGLQINIDGHMGIIKTVTGGRTLVDFNHPLAGKELIYSVKVHGIVTDTEKKLAAYMKIFLGEGNYTVSLKEGDAFVELPAAMPPEVGLKVEADVKACIPELKSLKFAKKEAKIDVPEPAKGLEAEKLDASK